MVMKDNNITSLILGESISIILGNPNINVVTVNSILVCVVFVSFFVDYTEILHSTSRPGVQSLWISLITGPEGGN